MSKAECPYGNATMKRFYNTLKNELYTLTIFIQIQALMGRLRTILDHIPITTV